MTHENLKDRRLMAAAFCGFLASVSAMMARAAPSPAAKCQAKKETAAGVYYLCRAKADMRAILRATATASATCAMPTDSHVAKLEWRRGGSTCNPRPSEPRGEIDESCAAA